jgi:hypothetical protein
MNRVLLTGLALIAASSVILGCDLPERPEVITISQPPISRPAKPSDVKTVEEAMAVIMTVCKEDLHLPIVDPIQLFLYKDTASFEAYGAQLGTANATASAQGKNIHINLEKTRGRRWLTSERLALVEILAHEYSHVIQNALARTGLKPDLPLWFKEGFADWVAAKVLDSLGWQDYGLTLHRAKLELAHNRDLLTPLDELDWLKWHALAGKPKGYVKTYVLAFVAVDRLISMEGFSATLQSLKTGDFAKIFQASPDAFQADFQNYLSNSNPPNNSITMQKPNWTVGDQWVYEEKSPEARRIVVTEVVREDAFQGIPSYVVKRDSEESFYAKETLGLIATMEEGKLTLRRDQSAQIFSWPLAVGKEWRNTYAEENLKNKSKDAIDLSMVVSTIEETTVPAGTFEAARIETYDPKSGRLLFERWYSPQAKFSIKTRAYVTKDGLKKQDLISLKVTVGNNSGNRSP